MVRYSNVRITRYLHVGSRFDCRSIFLMDQRYLEALKCHRSCVVFNSMSRITSTLVIQTHGVPRKTWHPNHSTQILSIGFPFIDRLCNESILSFIRFHECTSCSFLMIRGWEVGRGTRLVPPYDTCPSLMELTFQAWQGSGGILQSSHPCFGFHL